VAYKRNSPEPVVEGGTGIQTATAYSVLCGGTTGTAALQSVASLGTAGQLLTSNGTAALPTWQNNPGTLPTYQNVTTSPYVASASDQFLSVDTSSLSITIELPNAPVASKTFIIKDRTGTAGTRNITVTTVGGTVLIDGAATFVANTNYQSINLIFNGTGYEVF
jgi:hypothetical protein